MLYSKRDPRILPCWSFVAPQKNSCAINRTHRSSCNCMGNQGKLANKCATYKSIIGIYQTSAWPHDPIFMFIKQNPIHSRNWAELPTTAQQNKQTEQAIAPKPDDKIMSYLVCKNKTKRKKKRRIKPNIRNRQQMFTFCACVPVILLCFEMNATKILTDDVCACARIPKCNDFGRLFFEIVLTQYRRSLSYSFAIFWAKMRVFRFVLFGFAMVYI